MSIVTNAIGSAPTALWEVQATLGEGVLFDAERQQVWFVDIKGKRLHCCAPDGSGRRSWDAPGQVSFVVRASDGGLVVSLEDGLYRFIEETGEFVPFVKVETDRPANRFNDGFVDGEGRLWFGSMDDGESAPTGALYRFDGRDVVRMDDGIIITNGPAVSPDGRTLYHTDTLAKQVYAFDLADDGSLSNKRLFADILDGGHPDGMAVDAEGHVWIAVFRGWRIERRDPTGRKVGELRFPCSNITKLAFAGDDLRTVYATTARKGLSPEELAEQPLAGALFTFRAETPGLPANVLKLQK
jgi:sugar lactone lactonase YvrE